MRNGRFRRGALRAAVLLAGAAGSASAEPADSIGAPALPPPSILSCLPGGAERAPATLETRVSWRPGAREAMPAMRREIVSAGPAFGLPDSGRWLGARGGIVRGSRQGRSYMGEARLRRLPFADAPLRARAWARYVDDGDASPSAVADGPLPHNGRRRVDLGSRLELGRPGAAAPWGLGLWFSACGWARDHFLEVYRLDPEHAPREEGARIDCGLELSARLAARTRARLDLRLDGVRHSLADGRHRKDLRRYASPGANRDTDASGLYWAGSGGPDAAEPHVFDYYRWLQARESSATLTVRHAPGVGVEIEGRARVARSVYRRFEHFAPITIGAEDDPAGRALVVGYDPVHGVPADSPFPPGRASLAEAGIDARARPAACLRLGAQAGVLAFSSGDSTLARPREPFGGDGRLDAADLAPPGWHVRPEFSLTAEWSLAPRARLWALGRRQAHLPPLEALYSVRPYLSQVVREGVLGNPALAPEVESGGEIGLALPVPLLPGAWQLALAGHAARIDDAISMGIARLGAGGGAQVGREWVPVYENGDRLRRRGVHGAITAGADRDPWWARLSYDWGRIESRAPEPVLLDEAWLYPDIPQGEYASEGYAGPLGGVLDAVTAAGPRAYRPSYFDREHCLSLALVRRASTPPAGRGAIASLLRGWTLGAAARFETGRPYSRVFVHPAVLPPGSTDAGRGTDDPAWATPVHGDPWNGQRMPASFTLDLALQRRWRLGARGLRVTLEAFNLLGAENAESVYRATGQPDFDGYPDASAEYAARSRDPLHYGPPRVIRGAVSLDLLRDEGDAAGGR